MWGIFTTDENNSIPFNEWQLFLTDNKPLDYKATRDALFDRLPEETANYLGLSLDRPYTVKPKPSILQDASSISILKFPTESRSCEVAQKRIVGHIKECENRLCALQRLEHRAVQHARAWMSNGGGRGSSGADGGGSGGGGDGNDDGNGNGEVMMLGSYLQEKRELEQEIRLAHRCKRRLLGLPPLSTSEGKLKLKTVGQCIVGVGGCDTTGLRAKSTSHRANRGNTRQIAPPLCRNRR